MDGSCLCAAVKDLWGVNRCPWHEAGASRHNVELRSLHQQAVVWTFLKKKNNHLRNDTLFCTARFLHCSRSTAPRRVASCLLIDIRSSQDIQPALRSKSENSLKCFAPRPFFFFFLFFFQSDFIIESPLTVGSKVAARKRRRRGNRTTHWKSVAGISGRRRPLISAPTCRSPGIWCANCVLAQCRRRCDNLPLAGEETAWTWRLHGHQTNKAVPSKRRELRGALVSLQSLYY